MKCVCGAGRIAALLMAVAFAGSLALASEKGDTMSTKGTVAVRYDATIGGEKIEQGNYSAELTTDPDPVLVLRRGGKVFTRVHVERLALSDAAPYDQVRYKKIESGEREIVNITFKGQHETFVVKSAEQVANRANP